MHAVPMSGAQMCSGPLDRHVLEVRDLPHLDRVVEQSGSSVVAIAFYSRVCHAHPLQTAVFTGLRCGSAGQWGGSAVQWVEFVAFRAARASAHILAHRGSS